MGNLKLDTECGSSAASETTLGEGTEADYFDMKRMGKKQELKVSISYNSATRLANRKRKLTRYSDCTVSPV
jgi:hypothetical protein